MGSLLTSIGTELVWQLLGSLVAALVAVASVLPLLRRVEVSPARLLAGAYLGASLPLLLSRPLLVGWDEPGTEQLRVTTFAAMYLVGPLTAGPALCTTLLSCAFAGARHPERAWWRALVVVAGGLGIAIALPIVGHQTANPLYADLRAVVYAALFGVAAVASLGAGPRAGGGPDAGTAGAALLPVVVALGESSERGLVWLVASRMTTSVAPEWWGEFVTRIRDAVALEWTTSWAVLAAAVAVAGVAAFRRDAPGPTLSTWLAGAVLSGLVLWGAELSPARLAVLGPTCTGAPPPGTSGEDAPQGEEQPQRDELEGAPEAERQHP
jgi:hypothetical protein